LAIKFYCKAEGIKTAAGRIAHDLQNVGIEKWVDNKLRIELRLLSKELMKLGIVNDLMIDKVKSLFSTYVGRIDMSKQIALRFILNIKKSKQVKGLPTCAFCHSLA
jgi:hypothetical protein